MAKKIAIYVAGIFVSLALPFLVIPPLFRRLPAAYGIDPVVLSPQRDAFDIQSVKNNLRVQDVERLR